MAEVKQYTFSFKEVAEALVKKQGIRAGLWGIYVEFGLSGTTIQDKKKGVAMPMAMVPILKLGLQKYDTHNLLTVDAAKVNPARGARKQSLRERMVSGS